MGRTLRSAGLILLAGTAWLMVADALGWISEGLADPLVRGGIRAGLGCLAAGLLLGIGGAVVRELARGRCVRCGAPVEKGQTYCADHLQETVLEYRNHVRDVLPGPSRRD